MPNHAAHQPDTHKHQARSLMTWLAQDPARMQRAGVTPLANANTVSSSDRDGMAALFAPVMSSSGAPVTERTALQVATVYGCLSRIAGAITQLPIHQYQLTADGERDRMQPTPLWWMLNESPAPNWTAAAWKEWIVRCVGLRGDQHTEIVRSRSGAATGLKVHHPDYVRPRLRDSRLVYDVQDLETGRAYGVDQDDMLHFTGFGFDGVRSLSVISFAARQAIGNSLTAADFAGRTLGENAIPQVAIEFPNAGPKTDAQKEEFRQDWAATYGGAGGRKFPLVLTGGATAKELSISPVDLELMKLRDFETDQICTAFGVPSIILGTSKGPSAWGTGIEQVILGFVRFTIAPHLVRWTEELNRKLFRRAGMFLDFELNALLRGDAKSQAEFFRAALGGPGTGDGWMGVNEVRRMLNRPSVEGGDTLYKAQAGTTAPAGTTNQPAQAEPAAAGA